MKKLISQILLLSSMGVMFALYQFTVGSELQELVVSAAAFVIILLSLLLEYLYPYQKKWNSSDNDFWGDVGLFVLISGVLDSILKFGSAFLMLFVLKDWSTGIISLPIWIQAILVGLILEFGAYVSHYLHHKNERLWALHAMHHSPKRLYTLNNFRFHPANYLINYFFMFAPVLLLGFSAEAVLLFTAVTFPVLLLQHSNIDSDFGRLSIVLNTNEAHRWHHSNQEDEGNTNYGRITLIFDHIFKTHFHAAARRAPNSIGLFSSSEKFPKARNTLQQLVYPFTKNCCARL